MPLSQDSLFSSCHMLMVVDSMPPPSLWIVDVVKRDGCVDSCWRYQDVGALDPF